MSHPAYPTYLEERKRRYEEHSNIAYEILRAVPGLKVNRTNGAFYMAVAFEDGVLTEHQTLPVGNPEVRALVEKLVAPPGTPLDKRFVYYLLASAGICVVPLSSFCTQELGFRITLLEPDREVFTRVFRNLATKISEYLRSGEIPARAVG